MPTPQSRRQWEAGDEDPVSQNLRILTSSARATLAPDPLKLERELGLRFVVRVRGRSSAAGVRYAIRSEHGLSVWVRPFPAPNPLWAAVDEQRFIVTLPGLAWADVPVNPFDLARRLAATERIDVVMVEPDLPAALSTGNVAATPEVAAGIPFCTVDNDPGLPVAWHLDALRVPAARELAGSPAHSLDKGIVVGHPDTGWAEHDELDRTALKPELGYDFVDEDQDPRDPLERDTLEIGQLAHPGHGLGTGSVIISSHSVGQLNGVSPGAMLVPIRTTNRVWQVFSGNIARAIEHAVAQGCHVISISLGGFALFHLEEALNDAVARDVIVCAAAGNCISVVPCPAAYPNCVAIAASDYADLPWHGSSRGPAVDVAAPGVNIWVARRRQEGPDSTRIGQSQGASPATAATAGIAALWLAHHGRDTLLARYGAQVRLQHVFMHLLRQTARTPDGWDTDLDGAGIVDAEALLQAPLPTADEVSAGLPPEPLAPTPPDAVIAAMTGLHQDDTRRRLASALPSATASDSALDNVLARHGNELAFLLAQDRAAYADFISSDNPFLTPTGKAGSRSEWLRWASEALRKELAR